MAFTQLFSYRCSLQNIQDGRWVALLVGEEKRKF